MSKKIKVLKHIIEKNLFAILIKINLFKKRGWKYIGLLRKKERKKENFRYPRPFELFREVGQMFSFYVK